MIPDPIRPDQIWYSRTGCEVRVYNVAHGRVLYQYEADRVAHACTERQFRARFRREK